MSLDFSFRQVTDTFLRYLADNLTFNSVSVPIHAIRCDSSDPSADSLKDKAINVQFLDIQFDTLGYNQAVLDVIHSDENTARDWLTALWALLSATFMTPVMDYTNPTSPVVAGGNIFWDHNAVRFRRVANDNYCHYSCILPVRFSAIKHSY